MKDKKPGVGLNGEWLLPGGPCAPFGTSGDEPEAQGGAVGKALDHWTIGPSPASSKLQAPFTPIPSLPLPTDSQHVACSRGDKAAVRQGLPAQLLAIVPANPAHPSSVVTAPSPVIAPVQTPDTPRQPPATRQLLNKELRHHTESTLPAGCIQGPHSSDAPGRAAVTPPSTYCPSLPSEPASLVEPTSISLIGQLPPHTSFLRA
ncbi:hypothetical protein GGTG_00315 [Gaeumannomyces tritici R3-111a-1]|uniref:Uncharacterized protein n=1 Tax=Gaeumannomyces tritici (strain R3-111a-1) TaxID=644352 RepID=J3NGC4_GAET3|nr:hypothetical protein GGTG_00315 [Gaeumannomyces tritici R3-111a-1]EJT80314.1 hypothetical protein GGTG_00315 [Gaeumannomyces tritici R3-111a-1]